MSPLFDRWIVAFVITMALEVPIIMVLLRGSPPGRRLLAALVANGISHPTLWFLLTTLPIQTYGLWLATSEAIVWGMECALYIVLLSRWVSMKRVAISTTIANVASCAAGVALATLG
jgi:hypothetical protein